MVGKIWPSISSQRSCLLIILNDISPVIFVACNAYVLEGNPILFILTRLGIYEMVAQLFGYPRYHSIYRLPLVYSLQSGFYLYELSPSASFITSWNNKSHFVPSLFGHGTECYWKEPKAKEGSLYKSPSRKVTFKEHHIKYWRSNWEYP